MRSLYYHQFHYHRPHVQRPQTLVTPSPAGRPRRATFQPDGPNHRRRTPVRVRALGFHDDSFDAEADDYFPLVTNDDEAAAAAAWQLVSSSSDEDSDEEYVVNPLADVDLTTSSSSPSTTTNVHDYLTVTAHRLALMGKHRNKHRIKLGIWINLGLIAFLTTLLLFVDCCAWKIVRLPLDTLYLSRPFFLSAALVWLAGYVFIPLLKMWKIVQTVRIGRVRHVKEREVPTIGGIFFVPIGLCVARFMAGFSSVEILAAAMATLSFAAIGLLEDAATVTKNHSGGLSAWIKLALEAAVGTLFSFWLDGTDISSPYSMKMLVPLPAPLGLVFLGRSYLVLSSFCFFSMANGVNQTNGLDGLAGGTAALAFIGMSIAVLPICCEMSIFGASMAGACVGFLLHNQYRASVLMGETGSLALGGGLAAMAACTGMFFPLVISSGVFVVEAASVIAQVVYSKTRKHPGGRGRRLFPAAPVHRHLELFGLKEPMIVAGAYCISSVLALVAGYVGLISA